MSRGSPHGLPHRSHSAGEPLLYLECLLLMHGLLLAPYSGPLNWLLSLPHRHVHERKLRHGDIQESGQS